MKQRTEVKFTKNGKKFTQIDMSSSNKSRFSYCPKCGGKLISIRQEGRNSLLICNVCAKGYLMKLTLLELSDADVNPMNRYALTQVHKNTDKVNKK